MLLDENKPDNFLFDDDELDRELETIDISHKVDVSDVPDVDDEEDDRGVLQELFSYVKILIAAVVLALIMNHFIIINATIPTGSMTNTIMEGDRIIGLRLSYILSEPERGDIIIFKYPDDPTQKFVKRVIGLPGDVIEIKREATGVNVYVNGKILTEPYLKEAMLSTTDYTYIVPKDSYFVMGDNRNDSKDSRYWKITYVTKDAILAKALFRYMDVDGLNFQWLTTKYY